MKAHEIQRKNSEMDSRSGDSRTIGGNCSYQAFVSYLNVVALNEYSDVEAVEQAAAIADTLPHWFDRHRAVCNIAERVGVEADLIFKLMRKGGLAK
jgi:hypothetical protein